MSIQIIDNDTLILTETNIEETVTVFENGKGEKGDPAKELEIIVTDSTELTVGSNNHGMQFITTININTPVYVLIDECFKLDIDNNRIDHKGTVILFTQGTDVPIVFNTVDGVTLIKPKDSLAQPYGIGSSVGLIAKDRFTWILVGDVAVMDVYE